MSKLNERITDTSSVVITSVRNNRFTDWRVARREQNCGKVITQTVEFYCLPLILIGYKPF